MCISISEAREVLWSNFDHIPDETIGDLITFIEAVCKFVISTEFVAEPDTT